MVLVGIGTLPFFTGLRGAAGAALVPVQVGWFRLTQSVGDKIAVISSIGSLGDANLKLQDENDVLKAQLGKLQTTQQQNNDLRAQLGAKPTTEFQLVPVETLGYVPAIGTKEMLLAAGTTSGIKVGQTVIYQEVILGKIVAVQSDRSTLQLLTDPSVKVLVYTSGGAKGILVGQFQSSVELTKVLQQENLSIGDKVLTTGEENWPKNLVVGEVTKVIKKDNDLFQEAEVRPLVSYDKLQTVFVITGVK